MVLKLLELSMKNDWIEIDMENLPVGEVESLNLWGLEMIGTLHLNNSTIGQENVICFKAGGGGSMIKVTHYRIIGTKETKIKKQRKQGIDQQIVSIVEKLNQMS